MKIVSYEEFLQHKSDLRSYLSHLFGSNVDLTIYFPKCLSSDERHLVYKNSKGYIFEKLDRIASQYSIKMWRESVKEDNLDTVKESYGEDDEYSMRYHLLEISDVLEKQHDILMNQVNKCSNSVRRVEFIFTFIMLFNFVGSILFLTKTMDNVMQLSISELSCGCMY